MIFAPAPHKDSKHVSFPFQHQNMEHDFAQAPRLQAYGDTQHLLHSSPPMNAVFSHTRTFSQQEKDETFPTGSWREVKQYGLNDAFGHTSTCLYSVGQRRATDRVYVNGRVFSHDTDHALGSARTVQAR